MKAALWILAIVQVTLLISLSYVQCGPLNNQENVLRFSTVDKDRGQLRSYTLQANLFNVFRRGFPRLKRKEHLAGQLRNIPSATERDSLQVLHRSRRQSDPSGNTDDEVPSVPTPTSKEITSQNVTTVTPTDSYSSTASGVPPSYYGPPSINAPATSAWATAYPPNPTILHPSYGPAVSNYGPPPISAPAVNSWTTTNPLNHIAMYPSHSILTDPTSGYGPSKLWVVDKIYFTTSNPTSMFDTKYSNQFKFPYLYLPGNHQTAPHSYFKPSRPDHFQNFWEFSGGYFFPIKYYDGVH